MRKNSRLLIDRGWILMFYGAFSCYNLLTMTSFWLFSKKDELMWLFIGVTPILAILGVLVFICALKFKVRQERALLTTCIIMTIIFGGARVLYLVVLSGELNEAISSAVLYAVGTGVFLYRSDVLGKVISDKIKIDELNKKDGGI